MRVVCMWLVKRALLPPQLTIWKGAREEGFLHAYRRNHVSKERERMPGVFCNPDPILHETYAVIVERCLTVDLYPRHQT